MVIKILLHLNSSRNDTSSSVGRYELEITKSVYRNEKLLFITNPVGEFYRFFVRNV